MLNVLSVQNAMEWSWGLGIHQLTDLLKNYKFVRMIGQRRMMIDKQCECLKHVSLVIDPIAISEDLTDHFDLMLLQNLENLKLVRSNRKRVICRSGGMIVDDKNKADRYNGELAQVGAVIATNNQLCDIAKECNENAFLVPNGCDLDHFKPAETNSDRQFTMGFAGNIWGQGLNYKGYLYYVKAMTSLFGQVKSKAVLHAHSQLKHEDMPKGFYHEIDCLVLPTMGEGCSNVVMEALACGVPVLITKVGYHGEMLEDGKNCLFIERDEKDIEEKVLMLKNNPALRTEIAENGRKFAKDRHDIKEIAKEYDRIFQLVLNKE